MIQFHIPWEGGGLWWKFEIKTQDQTLSKNNNPGLVFFYQKTIQDPVSMNIFVFKVNNMKYCIIYNKNVDMQFNAHDTFLE